MSQHNNTSNSICESWANSPAPTASLLKAIKSGPLAGKTPEEAKSKIASLRREDVSKATIFVGTGTCGLGAGAGKSLEAIKKYLSDKKIDAEIVEVGCIGLCSEEPIVDVQLPGKRRLSFKTVTEEKVVGVLDSVFVGKVSADMTLGQFKNDKLAEWPEVPHMHQHPFMAPQHRVVLVNSGIIDPSNIDEYIARGGYASLEQVLTKNTPEDVCKRILESGLRGRGGGGFPTGKKWTFARQATGDQKYLVCNADEGDPGAFMDRAVGESDPHRLIEGMTIAAYAIGASKAYIYIRAEYPLAIDHLVEAIETAKKYGLLGENILGTGFNLEIMIKKGAGAFVCGEETALIHSVEGKRGMPRPRPPYPAVEGLFRKPTIINNVETLANVPGILSMGEKNYANIGTSGSKGTKVFALSGMVERTGLVEIPMGTPLSEIVFSIGGGVPRGKKCKAVQIGGPSGGCIPEAHLDLKTDYEDLKNFGAIIGSGGLVVLDENTCMVDLAKYFMEFIQSESCGKCIPCREGTKRMLEILESITRSRKNEKGDAPLLRMQGIMSLQKLAQIIKDTSLCGLGQTAPNPVLSTLKWFRSEYEAHVFERRCPSGSCKELVGAPCATACPVDTEAWKYVALIANGNYDEAYRTIRKANPFPSACARVCHHPCESICRCGTTGGDPIAIRSLKRFVTDKVDPSVYRQEIKAAGPDAKKIAVIGAGPSGLTAANALSLLGYKVSIFEKEKKPGGMMVCAIPEYRLPRKNLSQEIEALINSNIDINLGVEFGKDMTADSLLKKGYSAIYIATGCHKSKKMGIPGEETKGVLPGIEFLKAYNLDQQELAKGKVGIIGGGNSAVDAARVAIRQKNVTDVTIFYRRTRNEMPAYPEEIEAALEEGIKIETLVAPTKVVADGGKLKAVEFITNKLGDRDSSGRQRPVEIKGSEHEVSLDTLIVAISEDPDPVAVSGLKTTKWGTLSINPESKITDKAGVFGGGDVVRGPNTIIDAIADGKRAAIMIDRFVTGQQLKIIDKIKLPTVYIEPVAVDESGDSIPTTRAVQPAISVSLRKKNFSEVELSLSEEMARGEACRCLRCDLDFTSQ